MPKYEGLTTEEHLIVFDGVVLRTRPKHIVMKNLKFAILNLPGGPEEITKDFSQYSRSRGRIRSQNFPNTKQVR
jgi:hypothetical protein